MADDSTSRTPATPAKDHSWWRAALLTVLLLAASGGLVFALLNFRSTKLSVTVNENTKLRLVAVLTKKDPTFKSKVWQQKVYDKIPQVVKHLRGYHWHPKGWDLRAPLREEDVAFVIRRRDRGPDLPKSFYIPGLSFRLKYGEGWYSNREGIITASVFDPRGPKDDPLAVATIGEVPLTLEEFTLEAVQEKSDGKLTVLNSAVIRNPIFEKVTPVGKAMAVPATVTHNGVSVTLEALVSKTVGNWEGRVDTSGRGNYPDMEPWKFLRPEGTSDDPFYGAVAFRVQDQGSTTSEWEVDEIDFTYGKKGVRHSGYDNTMVRRESGNGLVQVFSLSKDLGVLNQPIKVSVKLRRAHFRNHDMQIRELELPTTGTYSSPAIMRMYGTNPPNELGPPRPKIVFISVANQVALTPWTAGNWEGRLNVVLEDAGEIARINDVELVRFDGSTLSLNDYALKSALGRGLHSISYDMLNRRRLAHTPAIDAEEFDQIRVSVASKDAFPVPFEIIAEPAEAQVPARAKF